MKKLSNKQMKQITGGDLPQCLRRCHLGYNYCITYGERPEEECQAEKAYCFDCDCYNNC